jgi:beta-lactamase regulating signal transducer with metallopeptidase domain
MTALWQSHEFQAIGWTMLHTLWQGAAVLAAAAMALRLLRGKSPQARYFAACASLAVMLALAIGTYAHMAGGRVSPEMAGAAYFAPAAPTVAAAPIAPIGATMATGATGAVPDAGPMAAAGTAGGAWGGHLALGAVSSVGSMVPWLAAAWAAGVIILSIRLLGGWCWLFRSIGRSARPAPSEWQWRLSALSRLLGVARGARLLVSEKTSAVLAVGWIRPAVLLPASALLRLSPESLEAILAHELAHIGRRDFLVNLLQSIVEVFFFYNPAAWWLSGQIRELREYCCDDVAAGHCGRLAYANALASLETLRACSPPQLAPAAKGASLMKRIQRILGAPGHAPAGLRPGSIAIAVAAVSIMGASALWGLAPDDHRRLAPDDHQRLAPDDHRRQEKQVIVIRDGDKSLHVRTKGQIDLGQGALDGTALEDGAAVVVAESENGSTRRIAVRREGGETKKTYSVNGEERAIDAETAAWINDKAAEIVQVQAYKSKLAADGGAVASFEIAEGGKDGKGPKVVVYSNRGRWPAGYWLHMPPPPPPGSHAGGPPHVIDLWSDADAWSGAWDAPDDFSVFDAEELREELDTPCGDPPRPIKGGRAIILPEMGIAAEDIKKHLDSALKDLPDLYVEGLEGIKGLGDYLSGVGGLGAGLGAEFFDEGFLPPPPMTLLYRRRGQDGPGNPESHENHESDQERKKRLQRRMDALQKRLAQLQEELDGLDSK